MDRLAHRHARAQGSSRESHVAEGSGRARLVPGGGGRDKGTHTSTNNFGPRHLGTKYRRLSDSTASSNRSINCELSGTGTDGQVQSDRGCKTGLAREGSRVCDLDGRNRPRELIEIVSPFCPRLPGLPMPTSRLAERTDNDRAQGFLLYGAFPLAPGLSLFFNSFFPPSFSPLLSFPSSDRSGLLCSGSRCFANPRGDAEPFRSSLMSGSGPNHESGRVARDDDGDGSWKWVNETKKRMG